MPKRPREHELEELSRRDFRNRLPPRWVVRDITPDYGIDQEVEVFATGGDATGLEFYAQLKGTDQALPRALSVSLPVGHADYYAALALPVLLGRFHAESGRLFAKWFHAYDPHYGESPHSADAKTFTFRWSEEDEWSEDTPERLAAEVEAFRRFRSSRLDFPVAFHLEAAEGTVDLGEALMVLRGLSERARRVIEIRSSPSSAGQAVLRFEADRVIANLGGIASVSVHWPWEGTVEFTEAVAADTLVAVALVFNQIGHASAAAQILATTQESRTVGTDPETTFRVASAFAQSGRLLDALRLARRFGERGDDAAEIAEMILSTVALDSSADEEIREEYRSVLRARAARRELRGAASLASAEHYSIGNSFRASHQARAAIRSYIRAAQLNPDYKSRPYFWHEMGGMLFESDHFILAASCYKRALDLGAGSFSRALLADALLYGGRYGESADTFSKVAADGAVDTAEWRLKRIALGRIRELGGDHQVRQVAAADASLANAIRDGKPIDNVRSELLETFALDALADGAWLALAALAYEENAQEAAELMQIAALLRRHDPTLWLAAFGLEWETRRRQEQLLDIATAADFLTGADFRAAIVEWTRRPENQTDGAEILDLINRAHEQESRDEGFTLRFGLEEGYEEVVFVPTRSEVARLTPNVCSC